MVKLLLITVLLPFVFIKLTSRKKLTETNLFDVLYIKILAKTISCFLIDNYHDCIHLSFWNFIRDLSD